jgi:hypothetical protein
MGMWRPIVDVLRMTERQRPFVEVIVDARFPSVGEFMLVVTHVPPPCFESAAPSIIRCGRLIRTFCLACVMLHGQQYSLSVGFIWSL